MVSTCLSDRFSEVKLESCSCVMVLEDNHGLHLVGGEGLVAHAQRNLPHQHRRVRTASVKAIGKRKKCDRDIDV